MAVKTALQLINRELDEYLGGIQGEFDADTRFAITWFEQNGNGKGDYGVADNLARARGISVENVKHAGIVESAAGKVRILTRDELNDDWEPESDNHLTVWECLQHLVKKHEKDGISHDTAVLLKKIGTQAEAVKDLAVNRFARRVVAQRFAADFQHDTTVLRLLGGGGGHTARFARCARDSDYARRQAQYIMGG